VTNPSTPLWSGTRLTVDNIRPFGKYANVLRLHSPCVAAPPTPSRSLTVLRYSLRVSLRTLRSDGLVLVHTSDAVLSSLMMKLAMRSGHSPVHAAGLPDGIETPIGRRSAS
jgi:hypothetical protein